MPVVLMVGYRGYTRHGKDTDTAATYTERIPDISVCVSIWWKTATPKHQHRVQRGEAIQGPVVVLVGDEYHGFNR